MTSVLCSTIRPQHQGCPAPETPRSPSFDRELIALLPNLRAFARSLSSNRAQADDLVQETCASAIDHVASFTPGTNMVAWLFTILRNKFYSQGRRRKREVEDVDGAYAECLSIPPNQDPAADLRDTMDALGRMKRKQREMLLVVGRDGVTYEEAARLTRCAVGTVKSRTHRARRVLNDLLMMTTSERSSAREYADPSRASAR